MFDNEEEIIADRRELIKLDALILYLEGIRATFGPDMDVYVRNPTGALDALNKLSIEKHNGVSSLKIGY